jgi:hypothetical protein
MSFESEAMLTGQRIVELLCDYKKEFSSYMEDNFDGGDKYDVASQFVDNEVMDSIIDEVHDLFDKLADKIKIKVIVEEV